MSAIPPYLAVSQAQWSIETQGEPILIRLTPYQVATSTTARHRIDEGFQLQAFPTTHSHSPECTLLYNTAPSPFAIAPLQLREQTEYLLEVESTNPRFRPRLRCFPQFDHPILRRDPSQGQRTLFSGRLNFRDYVGSAQLQIWVESEDTKIFQSAVEVRSKKLRYLDDYAALLDDIAKHAATLLLRLDSPVSANFEGRVHEQDALGYEQFLLLRTLLYQPDLEQALLRLRHQSISALQAQTQPTRPGQGPLSHTATLVRAYQGHRLQMAPAARKLPPAAKGTVPVHYLQRRPTQSLQCPENQFVMKLFARIQQVLEQLHRRFKGVAHQGYQQELRQLRSRWDGLSQLLPWTLAPAQRQWPLPRRHLSRHPAYRPLLTLWDQLDHVLMLNWKDLSTAIAGPIRDLAALYEIWCFFALHQAIASIAEPQQKLAGWLRRDRHSLSLSLARGRQHPLRFRYQDRQVLLYNQRHFPTGPGPMESYSVPFTPDYTVEIRAPGRPPALLCFDAKYRPEGVIEKMHTYRDALRSAIGCYVFFPGEPSQEPTLFHQNPSLQLAGVGAFPLRPHPETQLWLSAFLSLLFEQDTQLTL